MEVRHAVTHVTGSCTELNPSALDEIIVLFEDGSASSECITDYEVRLPGGWWDLADAIRGGDVVLDERGRKIHLDIEGLYGKYKVTKADGSPTDGDGKYFVLRLDTDAAARTAAEAYAHAVRADRPKLAEDLFDLLAELEHSVPSCLRCKRAAQCHTYVTLRHFIARSCLSSQKLASIAKTCPRFGVCNVK